MCYQRSVGSSTMRYGDISYTRKYIIAKFFVRNQLIFGKEIYCFTHKKHLKFQ